MKKYKNLLFYIIGIGSFAVILFIILQLGKANLETGRTISEQVSGDTAWGDFKNSLLHNIAVPFAILMLQIIVIMLVVKIFNWICKKIGQTSVIGEIAAGIVLGPSLLGLYFPEMSHFLFPVSSLVNINLLSQIGLILFMFIVGMELNLNVLKNRAHSAVIISHASIIFPFTLGALLAYFIYEDFTHAHSGFIPFALFMGIAMSITAFPVLARIVHEKGINKTLVGPMVITCAAIDDLTAWCLLAAVIAIAKAGDFTSSLYVIVMAVIYVIIMFKIVRPILKNIADNHHSKGLTKSMMGGFVLVLFLSAYATEAIGIHALFGAFLAGVIMPSNIRLRNLLTERIEYVTLIILLPLFFVFTGLRTEIGLLNSTHLWLTCFVVIAVAVAGKFLGSAVAARFVGQSWKDSLIIGALMNTRGLMELVVLNIGLDLGILTPELFAMMVIMALVTTFMTSPSLNILDKIFKKKHNEAELLEQKKFKVLVPFASSETGRKLLLLANYLVKKRQSQSEITLLHLSEGNPMHQYNIDQEEKRIFRPVEEEAHSLQQDINTMFEVTNNFQSSIIKIANKGEYDFLLIGNKGYTYTYSDGLLGRFSNSLSYIPDYILSIIQNQIKKKGTFDAPFDDRTRSIISKTNMSVGIFIDKGLISMRNILVPIFDEEDIFVGEFMERLAENSYVRITLWDRIGLSEKSIEFVKSVKAIKSVNPYLFQLWNNNIPVDSDILKKQDLILISLNSWKELDAKKPNLLKEAPSTLILTN